MFRVNELIGFAASAALVSTPQTSGDATATASGFNGNTWVNRTFTLNAGNYIRKFGADLRSADTITVKIVKRTGAGTYDVLSSENVSHTGSGWEDFTLATPVTIPSDGGTYYCAYYPAADPTMGYQTGTARAFKAGNITGLAQSGFTETNDGAPVMRVNQGL